MPEAVTVSTPATIGNFGPGFDVTSLALAWGGDRLTARPAAADSVTVTGPGADTIPAAWEANAAAIAFATVRERLHLHDRAQLLLEKGVPPGSGLGSSASSAAAGALAAARLLAPERAWTAAELHAAACVAEGHVAGQHGDDVAAALLGGLAIVRRGTLKRVDPPPGLAVAAVRPELALSTRDMRSLVPQTLGMHDAVSNLADIAWLIAAFTRGETEEVAACLQDRIAAPHRAQRLPFYDAVRMAAREAGAAGAAISGSGPSMFTVVVGLAAAERVAAAMRDAVEATGIRAEAIACLPESRHVWQEALR